MNEIQNFIKKLVNRENLLQEEAARAMQIILLGGATPAQISSYLTALSTKGINADEIIGSSLAIKSKMKTYHSPAECFYINTHDGSSRLSTSCASAIILRGCGLNVLTHVPLNRKHNSPHEILSSWNYNLQLNLDNYVKIFKETNLIFLPASLNLTNYRDINSIKNELGFESIFDFLMPFISPIKISHLIMETQHLNSKQAIIESSQMTGIENLCIFHNNNDENYDVIIIKNSKTIREARISFAELGLENKANINLSPNKLYQYPRTLYERLLFLNEDALMNRIYFETAISLYICDKANSLKEGVELVINLIGTKKIHKNMQKLVGASNELFVTC